MNVIVVRVRAWDEAALSALLSRVGQREVHRLQPINILRLEPPDGTDIEALLAALRADPLVVHAYVPPQVVFPKWKPFPKQ